MRRPFRIVHDRAILAEADAGELVERLALGEIGDLMIELAAHDEIDRLGRSAASFPARR